MHRLLMSRLAVVTVLLLAFLGAACEEGGEQISEYEQSVLEDRLEKDMEMRDSDVSPLSATTRERFNGLRYFPVDEDYRYTVEFIPSPEPESMMVEQRVGQPRAYQMVGHVEVPFEEETEELMVFQNQDQSEDYWLPFRDETTGDETYSAGRYLDIKAAGSDSLILDFNMAYNPYCEYEPEQYNCAIPPAENRLSFEVQAGEKKSGLRDEL